VPSQAMIIPLRLPAELLLLSAFLHATFLLGATPAASRKTLSGCFAVGKSPSQTIIMFLCFILYKSKVSHFYLLSKFGYLNIVRKFANSYMC
jgi:hypothetical protein